MNHPLAKASVRVGPRVLFPRTLSNFHRHLLGFTKYDRRLRPKRPLPTKGANLNRRKAHFLQVRLRPVQHLMSNTIQHGTRTQLTTTTRRVPRRNLPICHRKRNPPSPNIVRQHAQHVRAMGGDRMVIVLTGVVTTTLPNMDHRLQERIINSVGLTIRGRTNFHGTIRNKGGASSVRPSNKDIPMPKVTTRLRVVVRAILHRRGEPIPCNDSKPHPFPHPIRRTTINFRNVT